MKKEEFIKWPDIIKIPDPETTRTIFFHVVVHFWRAENDPHYFQSHFFPQDVSQVLLRIDHRLYKSGRYHVYEIGKEDWVGVWDETPYHVEFQPGISSLYLDHGDYRHDFQLFLRSFLKHIKEHVRYYPLLESVYKMVEASPLVPWKCSVCRSYNDWSSKVVHMLMLDNTPVAPSSLLYLLTHQNKKMGISLPDAFVSQFSSLSELLMVALRRFFHCFEKICEQTSATDPIVILNYLIMILEKYVSVYTIDQIHEFEQNCARDMKTCLYKEFKFLQTRNIAIHSFPRDMMIIRDIFPMLVSVWSMSAEPLEGSSPGMLLLFYHMLLKDPVMNDLDKTHVVRHALDVSMPITRPMTREEKSVFPEYHPLLRHTIFQSS